MAERERSVHLQTYHERTVLYTVYCNSPAVTAHTEQKEKAREKRQFQDPGCGDECLLRNMAYIVHKSMHSFFPEERERERIKGVYHEKRNIPFRHQIYLCEMNGIIFIDPLEIQIQKRIFPLIQLLGPPTQLESNCVISKSGVSINSGLNEARRRGFEEPIVVLQFSRK